MKSVPRLLRALSLLTLVLVLLPAGQAAAQQAPSCQFVLGFKVLHDLTPGDIGDCIDNQFTVDNGDAQQHTTKGLMVWRKADNWTAFTNGSTTWINGPQGLVSRPNGDRFPWEAAAPAAPTPTPTPAPKPAVKPIYAWYFKKVSEPPTFCGPGLAFFCIDSAPNAGSQYVGGHVIHKDGTLASGIVVQARVTNVPNLLYSTTGDDGLFTIPFGINCPQGPINIDVWLVDGGGAVSSYTNHITYSDCRTAGEFHFDFLEVSQ